MFCLAREEDYSGILEVQNENLINKNIDLLYGFLVNPIDETYLRENKHITFVLVDECGASVNGYFTGYSIPLEKHIQLNLAEDVSSVFFWKHIALKNTIKGTHIIKAFEDYCFSELRKTGYEYLIGEICLDPLNTRSLSFHTEVQGLIETRRYTDEKGYTWGVFKKKI
jgi:hypothetical protein